MHHYVRSQYTGSGIFGMTCEEFNIHISNLKKLYTIISPEKFFLAIENQKKLPKNSCLLTFDDGLADHYNNVYPILKKHKIYGLFFPLSMPEIENKFANVHKIHLLRQKLGEEIFAEKFYSSTSKEHIKLAKDLVKQKQKLKLYKWDNEKIALIKILANFIIPYAVLDEILESLFNENIKKNVTDFYLTDDQIKEMHKDGHNFGAHGHEHKIFSRLTKEQQYKDISISKNYLKNIIDDNISSFCYPYGDESTYTNTTISILKSLNFKAAFTSTVGKFRTDDNVFSIKRFDPKNMTTEKN